MPVRDKVYEKMKSFGLTDSKEDFYNYYDSDENVRKDVFRRLQEDGLTDTEEEFYSYMQPTVVKSEESAPFDANVERAKNGEPIQRVSTQSMIDANPELGLKNIPNLPTLKEQVEKSNVRDGKLVFGKPGFNGNEVSALYPMSSETLSNRLSDPRILDKDMSIRSVNEADEEKKIDAFFHSKSMKTAKDVYDNYSARFSNTERGIELGKELSDISRTITDKYANEYFNSDNYKKLAKAYQGKELNQKANEEFQKIYGETISNELKPYQEAYNNELAMRYGSKMDEDLKVIAKESVSGKLNSLTGEVESLLQESEDKLRQHKSMGGKGLNAIMGNQQFLSDTKAERKERNMLESAQELLSDSQNIVNEASKKGNTTFIEGLARGFWDNLNAEDFTFGLAELADMKYLNEALQKAENGEQLTPAEEKLLEASTINMATQAYFSSDLGRGYKAGSVSAESIPFMLEFIANPISGSGNAIAKGLLKFGLKRFGKSMTSKTAKAVGRLIGDATAAVGMTSTTGMPSVLAETYNRLNRNYNYGVGEDGELYVNKEGDTSFGEAFGKSFTTRAIENQSEMIFHAFKGAGNLLKGVDATLPGGVNTFFDYIKNSKVGELWRGIKNSPLRKELAEATKVGGIGEEYLEEVYNNLANVALGEMSMEEALNLDNNIDTFLGLAPTQVMFSMLGLGNMAALRYKTRRDIEDLRATMNESQRQALDGLLAMGTTATNQDVHEFIRNTMANQSLSIDEKRNAVKAAYDVARQKAMADVQEAEVEDKIAEENADIDAKTDPQTGNYGEVTLLGVDESGEPTANPANVFGAKVVDGELYLLVLPEGETEKKWVRPHEYDAESHQIMPGAEVKAYNEQMIRDNAAKQAEQEAKYAPDVLNAQMQQGIPFEDETAVYVPFQVTPEGNAWQVEVYNKDENGKPSKDATGVNVITNDQFRDMLQAQVDAQEAAVTVNVPSGENVGEEVNAEVNAPVNNENVQPVAEGVATEPQAEEVQPEVVEEVQQPQQQAAVIPTKEDGSIDFVSYGKDNTFKTLGEKYGEKMPNKVAVTAKAFAEDLVKAQEKLAKAEEAYDNAPIGREQKAEQARDKAKAELESIQREADFWSSLDNEIKEAQAKRDALLNPKADVDMSEEPINADEFIAQQLANGNIALESASYKKETGYGEKERQKFIKMFRKAENGGMSIESAGDLLMQMDRENGTNFFNQNDANAGRDALINFLGSVSSWGDVTGYIRNNREAQAAKENEGLRNEIEDAIEANYHMTPEEYATLQEMEAAENPFEGVDIEAKDAIFAEAALEFEEYLKSLENGQGTTEEVIEGNGDVLSEEQFDNSGGTEQRQGEGLDVSEGTVQSDDAAQEESAEVEEGNTPFRQTESILEQAERIANEEARRKPLRQRAKEWEQKLGVKVNIIENFDDVTNKDAKRAIRNGQRVTGWYEESTGEVCLYMPYLESAQEIDATYIHEVVAHKGLRGLLGDKFDEFLDDVWNAMSEADKLIYLTYPGVNGNKRAAADEFIAHLAENIDVTESAWGKLAELIKKFLKAIGLEPKMTHADIANTIKLSYQRLLSGEGGVDVVGDGTRFRTLEEINQTFNEELQQQIDGTLPNDHIYQLGSPSAVLLSTGIADVPIELNSTRLEDKSKNFGHDYDLSELKDLVKAIHNPMAIFAYGDKSKAQNIIVEIQHEGKNFIVGLSIKPKVGGQILDINSIRNVFPKDNAEWLNWVSQGKLLYADKERIQDLINQQQTNLADVDYLDLDSIANIVKDFPNPTLPEEKTLFRTVYHGSGASFDKFDHSFMGTGEGNQSFGWGTYVTDVEGIGKQYASIYAKNSPLAANALRWIEENDTYEDFLAQGEGKRRNWAIRHAKDYLKELKKDGASEDVIKAYEQDLVDAENALSEEVYNRTKENMVASLNRNLYEVEIPDNDGTNYIAWDKMLPKDQAERIKDAVRNSDFFKDYEKEYGRLAEERLDSWTKTNGGRAYKLLGNFTHMDQGADKAISQLLSKAGFVGFEYPANYMSGGNNFGQNNYVIFDEKDLQIKEHTRFRTKKNQNELVAVHNISEDNLRKVLSVGGLIMPSIAITKADMGHEGYGDISLLFDKETINPSDRRNKVYGGDAWTPRFPQITPKISEKVSSNVKKKIYELIEDRRLRENYNLSSELHFDQVENAISNNGVKGYYNKEWMKLAYLLDSGKKVKVSMKMKDYGDMSETIIAMAKDRGLKVSDIQQGGFDFYNENKDFVEAVKNIVDERKLSSLPEDKRAIARKLFGEKEMRFVYFDTLISAATRMEYDLEHGGLQQILDRTALRETIEKKVKTNNADYNKWVDNLFDGIVEKYGIRNERDWYTPSGNLRPWEQLYNNVTPANILRYMLAQSSQGGSGGLFDSNIMGAAAETYGSIEEIREKGKKRLRRLEEGEYDEWSNSITERVSNITYEFLSPSQKDEFGSSIDAMIAITNAVAKDKTANGIYKEMKSEYPRFTMDNAKELEAIVKEIQEQAIGYFEAKPQRIVSLSEVRKAVVPSNVSEDILEGLQNNGIEIATYKKGNEASRKRVIKKESEGIRFRFIGERGARNLDKAEEATTRLDNLSVAREMEAAEKDAKTIKMATGWERGADGLWRYEVDDNLKFDLSANVDYRKRHPEFTRFEDLRHKYNAYLFEIGDPLTEEEQKEYDSLENEFGGNTELHRSRKLKDYVDAPELFEAYPELRNIDLSFVEMDRNTEGKYLPNTKSIQLNENIKFAGQLVIGRVLVHEIQHAIQHIEGFEPGANENMQNPNKVQQKASNIEFMQKQLDKHISERNELLKKKDELNDKMSAWYDSHDDATAEDVTNDKDMQQWNREYDAIENELENADRKVSFDERWLDAAKNANTKLGYEGYRRVSGEVEARNVSRRMMLSADDRRNMLAVETEDVAREDQIFLRDGIEEGISIMRFRIAPQEEVQAEVDKFTSKYNGKEVVVLNSTISDEELESLGLDVEDVREAIEKETEGFYDPITYKIYIFADIADADELEKTLFHENGHGIFRKNKKFVNEFNENSKDKFKKGREDIAKYYKEHERAEELFVRIFDQELTSGNFEYLPKYLSEELWNEFNDILKDFGYDRQEESDRRRKGSVVRTETDRGSEKEADVRNSDIEPNQREERKEKGRSKEQAERLKKLFDDVADMGLRGVLGNTNYDLAMLDVFYALPEKERTDVAVRAVKIGGDVAVAVDEYLNSLEEPTLWEKVIASITNALRKVGIDVQLTENDVKYLLWRSRKPLDRNSIFDMAEDIDMRRKLNVGKFDNDPTDGGDTPGGGGTRFRSSDNTLEQIKQARKEIERNPSESQKEAGNYKKGHITLDGFDITLENPKGGVRSGVDKNGKKWSITMNNDYGYIRGTEAVDGDHVDVFLSDNPTEGNVFVVDQSNEDGSFDESKVMYGFNSLDEARDAYLSNYEKGWDRRIMAITGVSKDEFKKWIDSSHKKTKAFSEYKNVNPEKNDIRFRVANKLQIRDEYEATIKKGGYQAREAVQDAMLSLRRTQELIEKASGKKLRGFENAWEHENRLSSVVQAEIHEMERKFYKPMMDAVKKLAEAMGDKNDYAVADYLMLKHGIERNREMAVRKALTDTEGKIDRTQLEQWYKDKDAIRNDANLPTWREKQEAMDNAALNYGADMSVDYSGLTSMFGSDDLADCTDKAYKEVESLEKKYPSETKALGKAVKALNQNTIDKSFESGLMDRKVRDELKNDMYDYYVPLRGFDEVTSDEVYSYLDNDRNAFNAPLRRAKGRTSKADNPIAYMKSIAESGIMQGERNKMKQSFLNMVTNHPSDLISVREGVWVVLNPATGEWEAASMPTIPNNATPADVESILEAWESSMEQQAATNPNIKKVSEGADVPYRVIGNRMEQHQVIIKRNGKSYTLTVNGNPRLAMALNGLTNPNNTSKDGRVAADIQKAVDKMNRTLAAWYTTRNPDFVASNFMRDTLYTNTIVRAKEGNKYANKFHKHYAELLMPGKMLSLFNKYENGKLDMNNKTEKAFYDFIMNGGETGYSNLKDIEHIKNEIANQLKGDRLKWFRQVSDKLDLVNRAVENTSRFAAFLTSREMGRDMSKSIFDAKDISVNFNKKGAGGTFYKGTGQTKFGNLAAMVGAGGRGLYVFFNAAIQGSTNLLHVMKVNPKGTSAGLAAMFLMGAVLPYLLSGDDDKDYYDLPEHVRRNHLVLPGAGDTWVSIPLPIEYRIMYGMGELFTSWRTGHERGSNVALKALSLTGQALPLNFLEEGLDAFVPSALSPLWQAYNNRSWTGLPIYKDNEFNKYDPEYTKAYKNVDRLIYNFTKSLYDWTFDEENQEAGIDLNPAVIESLARGYFGGLFTQMSNIVKTAETIGGEREFDWRNIPIGNRIFKSGDEQTKEKRITNEYFNNMEKLDFLESRRRMLNRTIDGKAVPEEDVEKAKADLEQMIQTGVYQKYMKFKEYKKVADKIRKAMKDNGSTEELQRKLSEAQEKANEVLR